MLRSGARRSCDTEYENASSSLLAASSWAVGGNDGVVRAGRQRPELLLAGTQGLLGALALRDVLCEHELGSPAAVHQRVRRDLDLDHGAVLLAVSPGTARAAAPCDRPGD